MCLCIAKMIDRHDTPVKGDAEEAPALALMLVPTDANSDATTAMAAKLMLDSPTELARPSPNAHAATPKASASATLSTVGQVAMAVVETLALTVCTAASALVALFAMSPAKHELSTAVISHLIDESLDALLHFQRCNCQPRETRNRIAYATGLAAGAGAVLHVCAEIQPIKSHLCHLGCRMCRLTHTNIMGILSVVLMAACFHCRLHSFTSSSSSGCCRQAVC